MNKFYVKMMLLLLAMGFCIFFGVDLATRGMERIQGPIVKAAPESGAVRLWPQAETPQLPEGKKAAAAEGQKGSKVGVNASTANSKAAEAKAKKEAEEQIEPRAEISETAGVARIGNKAGELLQIIAHHGIRWFVSLFEAVAS